MRVFFNTFSKIFGFLTAITVFLIILISLISLIANYSESSKFSYYKGEKTSSNKIAILSLSGPILSEPLISYNFNSFLTKNAIFPNVIENYLTELTKENILGLIVSINSPGGSVSASSSIYSLFKKFKDENNIPIYFHSNDMLASGAYWVSLSGNKIFTNYGALVGSIGVKGPDWLYYNSPTSLSSGLLGNSVESKNGLKLFSNSAGKSKDIFNPFRKPDETELSQLKVMVNNIYEDFVNLVSVNRKIEKNIIKNEIGAMIYDSKTAKKNFLIDDIKNLDEIIEIMSISLSLKNKKIILINEKKTFGFNNLNIFYNIIDNQLNANFEEFINKKFCNNFKNQLSVVAFNNQQTLC